MNTLAVAIPIVIGFAILGVTLWLLGRGDAEKEIGAQKVRDEITQEALDAKKREAKDYAAARSDSWSDDVDKL